VRSTSTRRGAAIRPVPSRRFGPRNAKDVHLDFNQGAALPDPAGRLGGTGTATRHLRLAAPADLADPALRALLQAAVAPAPRADVATPGPHVTGTRTCRAPRAGPRRPRANEQRCA
jgi:hypothetical protein